MLIILGGLAHAQDPQRISQLAGDIDYPVATRTRGAGGTSTSIAPRRLPALPVETVRTLPPGRAIVLARRTPPVHARLQPWWRGPHAASTRAGLPLPTRIAQRAATTVDIDVTDLRQVAADLAQLREDVNYLLLLLEPSLTGPAAPPDTATATAISAASTAPKPGAAHIWRALTPTEAARAWDTLTGWVDWLVDRYSLDDTLPGCWYRHGAIVDELDALRASWTAAYLDPAARPTDSAYWLDLLHRTLDRIRDWDRYGCAAGTHHNDSLSLSELGDSRHDRDDFVFADVNARAESRRHQVVRHCEPSSSKTAGPRTCGSPEVGTE